ncbi:transient receptor potential cation channel subfamily M member-like 2 isoform X2 [Paramacrobiotus metropolitanus]|uniref:transient receptor potential cation channel subfamily M member-like 2 isoform X2 n=1 Tax=Paramacrobiotus metropolitanus TaxID=2943436 RepID=UPI002446146A|nr:transient receptor potential cation channel subfamily M member-like 2 isoform X2 [Paramacrobiotus metropolitanus]
MRGGMLKFFPPDDIINGFTNGNANRPTIRKKTGAASRKTGARNNQDPLSFLYAIPEKPYMVIKPQEEATACAQKILDTWHLPFPHLLLSVVGGTKYFDLWKREDHRAAFQKGLMKIMKALDVWLITDGLNYGITRLIGTAIKHEEHRQYRDVNSTEYSSPHRKASRTVTLISMVPCSLLTDAEQVLHSKEQTVPVAQHGNDDERQRFGLHWHHTHFVLLEQPYTAACVFRAKLERALEQALAVQNIRHEILEQRSDPDLPDAHGTMPATGNPSDEKVPFVVLLFQGDLAQLDLIHQHLLNRVPVILLEGCGYLADTLAMAVRERDAVGSDRAALIHQISTRLSDDYAEELRGHDSERMAYVEKILECVKLSRQGTMSLISIMDCTAPASEFSDLDKIVLKSILASESNVPNMSLLDRNLQLTIRCNRPEFAKTDILSKKPWKKMQIPDASFEAALILAGREEFVDMFMQQDFILHRYLNHLKLVKIFRRATDGKFFMDIVWQRILQRSEDIVPPAFVEEMLPSLLNHLAKFPVAVSAYRLSMNSLGDYVLSATVAERRACLALISWAVLLNRAALAKLLCKYCDDPIPTALFISSLYRGLAEHQTDYELEQRLSNHRKDFAVFATDILDLSVKDQAADRLTDILNERFPDFGYRTPIQMAYDSNNKWFLAHRSCQEWLNNFFMGEIQVSERFVDAKIILSAFLIFPMYFWIRFPRYVKNRSSSRRSRSTSVMADAIMDVDCDLHRKNIVDELQRLRDNERKLQRRDNVRTPKKLIHRGRVVRPPLCTMIRLMWMAPVTKFWTFQATYWAFLVLLGIATMMPNCRNTILNGVVLAFTVSYWIECILRLTYEYMHGMPFSWIYRISEIVFIFIFNCLFIIFEIMLELKFSFVTYFSGSQMINHFFGAFAGRIVMCFGVLYFYYRVITLFFPISRTLGPMLYRLQRMLAEDFVIFLKLLFPFFVANLIVLQTTIYPDWPMTGDTWRKGFHRAFFGIFIAPMQAELESTNKCEATAIYQQNGTVLPHDHCMAGQYSDITCPTVTLFSYGFTIQFMIVLRLVLLVILTAMFNNTLTAIKAEADAIWKYQRYLLIMQFASRPTLPPPFAMFGYMYRLVKSILHRKRNTPFEGDDYGANTFMYDQSEYYNYWTNLTKDYFIAASQYGKEQEMSRRHMENFSSFGASLHAQRRLLDQLRDKMGDVGKMATTAAFEAQSVRHKVKSMNIMDPFSSSDQVHILSRQSPYPETTLFRFTLLDSYCSWQTELSIYDPKEYTKPLEMYPETLRYDVDTAKPNPILTSYKWNTIDISAKEPNDRRSWIKTSEGAPITYTVALNGFPLNPLGRTGMTGRGILHKYGPNHCIYLVLVSSSDDGELVTATEIHRHGMSTIPQTFIRIGESEAEGVTRLLAALTSQLHDDVSQEAIGIRDSAGHAVSAKELYRGYIDDNRNTDNAWVEGVVWLLRTSLVTLDGSVKYRWMAVRNINNTTAFDFVVYQRILWKDLD